MCSTITAISLLFHIEHQTQTASLADFGTGAVSYAVILLALFVHSNPSDPPLGESLDRLGKLSSLSTKVQGHRPQSFPTSRYIETPLDTPARSVITFCAHQAPTAMTLYLNARQSPWRETPKNSLPHAISGTVEARSAFLKINPQPSARGPQVSVPGRRCKYTGHAPGLESWATTAQPAIYPLQHQGSPGAPVMG